MKQIFALFIIITASLSCHINRQVSDSGSQIGLRNLPNYYLKHSVALNSSYNGILIADADNFNSLFYADNMGNGSLAVPDFSGQMVVALALNSAEESRIRFMKADIKGNSINIYGKQNVERDEVETTPVAVATVPKYLDAKSVNFYIDGKLVKTVSVVLKSKSNIFAGAQQKERSAQKENKKKPAVV